MHNEALARQGIQINLDTAEAVHIQGDEFYLAGWFFSENSTPGQLILKIQDETIPVWTGISRPDVARHLRTARGANSGFAVRFPAPKTSRLAHLKFKTADQETTVVGAIPIPPAPDVLAPPDPHRAADYGDWIERFEPGLFWPENEISKQLSVFSTLPQIALLLHVANDLPYFLVHCLQSIRRQHYKNWQLLILNKDSLSEASLNILRTMSAEDSRICLDLCDEGGSLPQRFNAAITKTTAEFVSLISSSDELHPFALLEVVRQINTFGGCDVVYTDEDRMNVFGQRSHPLFKPAFDEELFLAFNYLRRLTVLRRELVLTLGGLRLALMAGFEWDLLLRALRQFPSLRVIQVAKPLYHTRMFGGVPEDDLHAGPNERKALMRVLSDHLATNPTAVDIEPGISFPLVRRKEQHPGNPRAAIIIRCRDGLHQRSTIEVNAGKKLATVYELIDCVLYRGDEHSERLVVSRLQEMTEDVFVFINGSLETINHMFCEELVMQALREECGVVAGLSLDIDLKVIASGFVRGLSGELVDPCMGMPYSDFTRFEYFNAVRSVEAVDHRFFAVKRDHLAAAGGIGSVSAAQMPRLVSRLVAHAQQEKLRVLITPYAIATFEEPAELFPTYALPEVSDSGVRINRNWTDFPQLAFSKTPKTAS